MITSESWDNLVLFQHGNSPWPTDGRKIPSTVVSRMRTAFLYVCQYLSSGGDDLSQRPASWDVLIGKPTVVARHHDCALVTFNTTRFDGDAKA